MNDVKDTVRRYILLTWLPGESPDNLRDETPLQTSGILDSLATQTLISFVEQEFGIELDVYDTSVERFDRIEDIAATVTRKQALGPQPPKQFSTSPVRR
jgi:acyl carrier protein